MNKRQRPELDPDRLRYVAEQAVAALAKTGRPPPADADGETLRRWHELQVSQIELDMQNVALAEVQSERDLAEAAREHYAALYDQAPAGYLSLDPEGRITRANHAAGELLGCRREELPGRSFEQFVAPQSQPGLRRFLAELLVSGRRAVMEVPLFAALRGGAQRQVHIEANLDVAARKCRMILTDIGNADAREAARRRAFQVIDSMGEGVMVCDIEKRIVSVNPAFTRLTGYPVEEALGRDPRFLGRPGAHPMGYHAEAMRCLCTYGRWQGEVFNRRRGDVAHRDPRRGRRHHPLHRRVLRHHGAPAGRCRPAETVARARWAGGGAHRRTDRGEPPADAGGGRAQTHRGRAARIARPAAKTGPAPGDGQGG